MKAYSHILLLCLIIVSFSCKDDAVKNKKQPVLTFQISHSESNEIVHDGLKLIIPEQAFAEDTSFGIHKMSSNELPEGLPEYQELGQFYHIGYHGTLNEPLEIRMDLTLNSDPDQFSIVRYHNNEWQILNTVYDESENQLVAYSAGLSVFGWLKLGSKKVHVDITYLNPIDYGIGFANELTQHVKIQASVTGGDAEIQEVLCIMNIKTSRGEYEKIMRQFGAIFENTSYSIITALLVKNQPIPVQAPMIKTGASEYKLFVEKGLLQDIHDILTIEEITVQVVAKTERGDFESKPEKIYFYSTNKPTLKAKSPVESSGTSVTLEWTHVGGTVDMLKYPYLKVVLSETAQPFLDRRPVAEMEDKFDPARGNYVQCFAVPEELDPGPYYWEARYSSKSKFKDRKYYYTIGVISFTVRQNQSSYVSDDMLYDERDGQTYKIVKIGSQWWMAENLKYKTSIGSWAYSDIESNADFIGRLYNWETAERVCPSGWHLPSDVEWTTLTDYLGGEEVSGGKLKVRGTKHWCSPNEATNETGFSALPAGRRDSEGVYWDYSYEGQWWSSSEYNKTDAWTRTIPFAPNRVWRWNLSKELGLSVRCIKD